MLKLYLIRYLLSLDNYNKYRSYISTKEEEKELINLYKILDILINKYSRDITLTEYKLSVLNDYPEYDSYTSQLDSVDVSQEVLSDLIKQVKNRSLAHSLALVSLDVSEGRKEVSELFDHVAKFDVVEENNDVEFVTDDLEELYNETVHTPGLRWRLKSLNNSLGSLRRGDFGFIFARPETGKTTFLASEVSFFAEQTNGNILWFNNEEQGNKVKVRCYQAALGITLSELYSDRNKWYNKYMEVTKGNIKIFDSASINKRQVEKIVKEYKPALILFDQIDKIKGFDSDRNDLRLGAIYIWARELAKIHCPVIGVCQSDVSGEGKKWLTMDNVAESKTSKQGEADWILGIGKTHDNGMEFVRYLHLSKNKLSGDDDTIAENRHGRLEVLIRPEVARYSDLEE